MRLTCSVSSVFEFVKWMNVINPWGGHEAKAVVRKRKALPCTVGAHCSWPLGGSPCVGTQSGLDGKQGLTAVCCLLNPTVYKLCSFLKVL